MYLADNNIKDVQRKLLKRGIEVKYSTLRYLISKHNHFQDYTNKNNIAENKLKITRIKRTAIIKYIFNWNYNNELIKHMDRLLAEYPFIQLYKWFYTDLKNHMTSLNITAFINLINSNYDNDCINRYIKSLKTDWDAVINASSMPINNGITEGNVNKLKKIKRDMYGRAR